MVIYFHVFSVNTNISTDIVANITTALTHHADVSLGHANVIDGDESTFYRSADGVDQWVAITLDAKHFISRVKVYNRHDQRKFAVFEFICKYSDNGSV